MKRKLLTAILVLLVMSISLTCIGVSATDTEAEGSLTRAEACQLVSDLMKLSGGNGVFADVNQDDSIYQAVANCYAKGYICGDGGGIISPNRLLTRQEACVIAAKVLGLDTGGAADVSAFADGKSVAPWAVSSVSALYRAGRLDIDKDNMVRPQETIDRDEMIDMLGQTESTLGMLSDLLLEDSAYWMDDVTFDPETRTYNVQVWLETYGVRFTPVITGENGAEVKVTMSGSGIETQTVMVDQGQQFTLDLTQDRKASNPEGTGKRGIEDECRYTVIIEDVNGAYTINITRPGLEQYVEQFERKTFNMSGIEGAEDGKDMTYWEYVPDSYDGTEAYPVVLYLHGIGQRANEATDVLLRNAAATTFAYYGKEVIVIAPQCNYSDLSATDMWTKGGFGLSIFGEGAYQILQATKEAYHTDSNRIYVVGLSMGGQGTCGMLASHPEEWAGAIVNAAPFDFGENNVALPTLVNAIKDHSIPVWFCYAEDDNSVDYTKSHDILIPALDQADVDYEITVYTPEDYLAPMRHFCWAPIWANEEILDWLLAQSR